jgi:hypothetical protein
VVPKNAATMLWLPDAVSGPTAKSTRLSEFASLAYPVAKVRVVIRVTLVKEAVPTLPEFRSHMMTPTVGWGGRVGVGWDVWVRWGLGAPHHTSVMQNQ